MIGNRRQFLFGSAGFIVGSSLTAYLLRKRRRKSRPVKPQLATNVDDWVLTPEDLNALGYDSGVPRDTSMKILDGTDFMGGGDFEAKRVQNAAECAAACEATDQCNAFTYAKVNHPLSEKKQMCWLKSEESPENVVRDAFYISGLKP